MFNHINNLLVMNNPFSQDRLRMLQLQYIQIDTITLTKFTNKYKMKPAFMVPTQCPENPHLKRLVTENLRIFENETNSNIFAYGYMLLITIYDDFINENLLNLIKSLLYQPTFNLIQIDNPPLTLTNQQIKKLMVEFIFELQFTDYSKTLLKTLQKYPVILYIMVLFLKKLLVKYGIEQAREYHSAIPTETAYEVLSELLDINYRNYNHSYIFLESHCVIYEESLNLIYVGNYLQSKPSSVSSSADHNIKLQEKNELLKIDRKHQNFNFDSTIRQSHHHDHDAPTPFFNLSNDHRQSINSDFKIQRQNNFDINPYFGPTETKQPNIVSEGDQYSVTSSSSQKSLQQKLIQLKSQQSGWKSPIFNNGIIFDDAQNGFNAFEDANKDAFLGRPKQFLLKQIKVKTQEDDYQPESDCQCEQKKNRIRLYSRVYEINLVNMSKVASRQLSYDCMIISIKNIIFTQATQTTLDNKIKRLSKEKNRRAQTFHQNHIHSLYDIDKSFQSAQPKSPKNLNQTCTNLNSSYYQSKFDSRIRILEDKLSTSSKAPKIKFTYTNKKL